MQQLKRKLETILRIKSRRYHSNSSGWVEIFCPFCNDATRKSNPDHGHLYFMPETNYFNCFRCSEMGSITKLLTKYNVYDDELFHSLSSLRRSDVAYTKLSRSTASIDITTVKSNLINSYDSLVGVQRTLFFDYLYMRLLDIDVMQYLISPSFERNNILGCSFHNHSNQFITTRYINHPTKRYQNSNNKPMYYYQDIRTIVDYSHIVICEGVFDVINLSNYYCNFKGSFFLAINGNQYLSAVKMLIRNYLRLGKYTISIVFDKGLFRENELIKSLIWACEDINPHITLQIFKPNMSKDPSELMSIEQIQ